MKSLTILQTFLSRFLIVALNFALVIFTTNFWGSEGKGIISMLIADLAVISFVSSIFGGSSVTYFASKFPKEKILFYAYLWSVVTGIVAPLVLSFSLGHNRDLLPYLIALSVITSLLATHINLFVGNRNIRMFNLYTILQQAVHIAFIFLLVFAFKFIDLTAYFIAQIVAYSLLFIISGFQLLKNFRLKKIGFSGRIRREMWRYGVNTQLSAFLQFLNYRLSYYFLEHFKGMASVGVYSVGVAVSEAIWTLSRSLSVILYSEAVNSKNEDFLVQRTKVSLKISFTVTFIFILMILILPAQFYTFIFGKDFSETKEIILLLSPGILGIATSNIVGHYFAGTNQLRILNIKSLVGLVFTFLLSFYLVPKFGIAGACIVTTVSYLVSSFIVFYEFYKKVPFQVTDFFFSKTEIKEILKKIKS